MTTKEAHPLIIPTAQLTRGTSYSPLGDIAGGEPCTLTGSELLLALVRVEASGLKPSVGGYSGISANLVGSPAIRSTAKWRSLVYRFLMGACPLSNSAAVCGGGGRRIEWVAGRIERRDESEAELREIGIDALI